MKLEKIEVSKAGIGAPKEYRIEFDDRFSGMISHYTERNMGHTMYSKTSATFSQEGKDLGKTEAYDVSKGIQYDDTNTIAGEHLGTVIEHLECIANNPKTKENAGFGKPLYELVDRAVPGLIKLYTKEKEKYESSLTKDEGPQVFTF